MSEVTLEALSALADALASEDDAEVLDAFWTLEDAVAADARRERRFDRLATAVRYGSSPDSEAFRTSSSYVEAAVDLDDRREDLSLATIEYLAADGAAAEARDLVQETIEGYESNRRRREELKTAGAVSGVPAVLAFEGVDDLTVPVGTRLTIDVPLSNVGSKTARNVALEVSDVFGSRIDPEEIASLDAGGSTTVKATVSPDRAGSAMVTASASTDRTGDDVSFGVEALDALGFIGRARRKIVAMIELVGSRGSGRRGGPSVERQLDRAVERLDSAAEAIERDAPSRSVDGKLGAAVNVLEAVRNRLANDAATGLDEVTTIELGEEITATIGTVRHAINAE